MEIFKELKHIEGLSLALGFFDGVHLGHQAVIKSATNHAHKNNNKSAVITFKAHPQDFLSNSKIKYITTRKQRATLIKELGIDYLFELDFSEEISNLTGEEYLKNIIFEYFKPTSISTGFNHTFGKNKSGTPLLLEKMQAEYNYKYYQTIAQSIDNNVISSSKIKEYLIKGDITQANIMLGHEFILEGNVIHGNHFGRELGFPTANIKYPKDIVELPLGTYSTQIYNHKSITNYGKKPTVCNACDAIVESHILNFNKNIYNTNIQVRFIKKIRDEKKFNSVYELKEQIKKDISEC